MKTRRFIPGKNANLKALAYRAMPYSRPAICEDCGDTPRYRLHGHHEDYAKPSEIDWLCAGCHRRRHFEALPNTAVAVIQFNCDPNWKRDLKVAVALSGNTLTAACIQAVSEYLNIDPPARAVA